MKEWEKKLWQIKMPVSILLFSSFVVVVVVVEAYSCFFVMMMIMMMIRGHKFIAYAFRINFFSLLFFLSFFCLGCIFHLTNLITICLLVMQSPPPLTDHLNKEWQGIKKNKNRIFFLFYKSWKILFLDTHTHTHRIWFRQ